MCKEVRDVQHAAETYTVGVVQTGWPGFASKIKRSMSSKSAVRGVVIIVSISTAYVMLEHPARTRRYLYTHTPVVCSIVADQYKIEYPQQECTESTL